MVSKLHLACLTPCVCVCVNRIDNDNMNYLPAAVRVIVDRCYDVKVHHNNQINKSEYINKMLSVGNQWYISNSVPLSMCIKVILVVIQHISLCRDDII